MSIIKNRIDELREYQTKKKMRIGYYGKSAKCRNLAPEEAIERINKIISEEI